MISEEEKELQQKLKHAYWDYLCAYRVYQSFIGQDYTHYLEQASNKLTKYTPNFNDFECNYQNLPFASDTDKRYGHIKSPASDSWASFMDSLGFKVSLTTPRIGVGNDFGIAVPDTSPLNGKWMFLDPNFACRYCGKNPITLHNLTDNNVLYGFQSIALLRSIIPADLLPQLKQTTLSDCFRAKFYADDVHTTVEYVDFTLCPLIERIRRYYRNVLKNNLFSEKNPDHITNENEKILWSIARARDVYLAHNNHYPPQEKSPVPNRFSYTVYRDGFITPKFLDPLNHSKIHQGLEYALMTIFNFKNRKELLTDMQNCSFPDLSVIQNGGEPAFIRLVRYLASTVNLKSATQSGFDIKKSKDVPKLLNLLGSKNTSSVSQAILFRDLALHDHFPFREFYGDKIMAKAQLLSHQHQPRNIKKASRINTATNLLIEATLTDQREDLKQTLSLHKKKHSGR